MDSALKLKPTAPTKNNMQLQSKQYVNIVIPIVPDDDLRRSALVNTETSASFNGRSKEPPQLVHSTDGLRNHWDLVRILSVCRS